MNQIVRSFGPLAGSAAPYEFREFPKWVEGVLCQDEEEEAAVLTSGAPLVDEAAEKKRLVTLGVQNDVKIDGRWTLEKMEAVLSGAGVDTSKNPFL